MTPAPDFKSRIARVLPAYGLSLPEYHLLCTAGYRIPLPPVAFVSHTHAAADGDPCGQPSLATLGAALDDLLSRRMMSCLTELDLREDTERRRSSTVPEVLDLDYYVGDMDFAPRGYEVYRNVIREIFGDDFLLKKDAGFNLDPDVGRFDVYAASEEKCLALMDTIQGDGDSYTGAELTTFVETAGPTRIGSWRPNRFVAHSVGYHGRLRYVTGSSPDRGDKDG